MRKLVPGMVEGVLKVLPLEPPVPYRKSPVPYDSSVGFEGGVKRSAGTINSEEGENRVPPRSRRRGRHRDLNPGAVQARV